MSHILKNGKGVRLFGKGPQRSWVRWAVSPQQQFGCSASGAALILCSEVGGTEAMTCLTLHCRAAILTVITITGPEN